VSKVYDKLLLAVNSGLSVKTSPYLSLTDLTERQKEILWKNFINKTEPIEKQYIKDLKKYFAMQEKVILERMSEYDDTGRFVMSEDADLWIFNPEDWNDELNKLNTKYNLKAIVAGGNNADKLRKSFDERDATIIQYLAEKELVFAFEVNEATSQLLRKQLATGIENQEDMRQLSKRVANVFGFNSKYRSKRIAQTEVIGAANFGTMQSSIQSGVVWGHQWLAAFDSHTRDTHRQLGAEQAKAKVGERFSNGLLYPGEQSGDPAGYINCRCALKPLTREPTGE